MDPFCQQISNDLIYSDDITYLATGLKANPFQLRANRIDNVNEVFEKGYVLFPELLEIIVVDIRSEESMCHILTDMLQSCCGLLL